MMLLWTRCDDNPGRPRKFEERDERSLVRAITTLRNTNGIPFTAGLHYVALGTVRHYINKNDYYFQQLRRKGEVTAKDRKSK